LTINNAIKNSSKKRRGEITVTGGKAKIVADPN
jgi:hypothetical protein